ncbi:glucokinase [Desulfopila sp. IMCC35006]|uniref:glucokinase n=1 Tax=Desulfopila sp. IMCC35006 TaxID=2569542 RepID=UPI0010AC650C|nr:glucokinase [Desulfopila sp. IMCC35006]TKB28402.1 glucokinase [Desulfopila sp. IMCC35006]
MILAGDIGGTKTALGIYSPEKGIGTPLARETFASAKYACLEDIVAEFRLKFDFEIEKAAFGVAGPVAGGKAVITNLPWTIDEDQLKNALDTSSVKLLNDLEAISWSVSSLEENDIYALNDNGEPEKGGTIAVIAPGTGLGEAFLVWDGSRYLAHASEGGHADLAPTNELEIELLRYLLKKYERVSYERVCSGIGIPNIYNFFKDSGRIEEPAWLMKELVNVQDPTPLIVNTALEKESSCPICKATLDMFISFLGAEAGNMALKILPTGGVYLGGGIPPRILPQLQKGLLMKTFLQKGRMSKLLSKMPVNVILKSDMALTGTAYYGLEIL